MLNETQKNEIIKSNISIFQKVKKLGIDFDNYYSDLYLFVNDDTTKIIDNYEFKSIVTTFKSAVDGIPMYEVPFAYEDYKR